MRVVAVFIVVVFAALGSLPAAGASDGPGPATATSALSGAAAPIGSVPESAPLEADPDEFQALTPARLLDTRDGTGGVVGPLGPMQTVNVTVAGRGGVPASGVGSVVVNLTSTQASTPAFITAWPTGTPQPLASNLNTEPGVNTPNLAIVKVGSGGRISLYNSWGAGHLVVDVLGYFPQAATFTGVNPCRLLDTREGTAPVGPGETISLPVTDRCQVPADDVGAVVLNLTSTQASSTAFVTAWPTGEERPLASNLNTDPGVNTPNLAIVKVSDLGSVDLFNSAGNGHLVVDVMGWFPTTSNYRPDVPARIMDTRDGTGLPSAQKLGPKETVTLDLPDAPIGAVVVNLTSTEATTSSFVTAWPAGEERPLASNLNTDPGDNTPNLAIIKLGAGSDLSLYNSAGNGHLVVDIMGWFPIGSEFIKVSEPGFEAEIEVPSTTKTATGVESVTPSVIPVGAPVELDLYYNIEAGDEPYEVGSLVRLGVEEYPPEGFVGQATAVVGVLDGNGDPTGHQTVTAQPGDLRVTIDLSPGGETFFVDDHIVIEDSQQVPGGFLGRVLAAEALVGGGQRVMAAPGNLEDAFLDIDIDIDAEAATAAGTVEPTLDDGTPLAEAADQITPSVTGELFYGINLENTQDSLRTIKSMLGQSNDCRLEGLQIQLGVGLGYDFGLRWKWYWFIPKPLVTAKVTPLARAEVRLDKAAVDCAFSLVKIKYGFEIPKVRMKLELWVGALMDVEVGTAGWNLFALAEAGVTMGIEDNKAVFDPYWTAQENFSSLGDVTDPRQLSLYAQVDLWFAVGVDVGVGFISGTVFQASFGPFAEFTLSQQSTRPWWALDLGLAAKISAFGKTWYEQEVPYLFDSIAACPTASPYTTPCRTPKPSERPNHDTRGFAPRLRVFSADDSLDPLTIETTSLPDAYAGESYPTPRDPNAGPGVALDTDGRFPAASWAVVSGALPPGLTLDPTTGVIGGVPTLPVPGSRAQTYSFTVEAKDAAGGPMPAPQRSLSITVHPQAKILTGPITAGIGFPFSAQLEGQGWGDLTWEKIGGDLPAGLTWDPATAMISGTSLQESLRFVTFKVTDSQGRSNTATIAVSVEKLGVYGFGLADGSPETVDVSADGNVIAFDTYESLEPTDTNGSSDIYVYDRLVGRLTRLGTQGPPIGDHPTRPSISDDGQQVAFETQSYGDLDSAILVYDLGTDEVAVVNDDLTCAAATDPGLPAGHEGLCAALLDALHAGGNRPYDPVISGDGSHVAYGIGLWGDEPGPQVLVYDRAAGTTRIASMNHASPNPHGECDDYGGYLSYASYEPSLSYDGSVIAFTTNCEGPYVVRLDLTTGAMRDVLPDGWSTEGDISGDGRHVAFIEDATRALRIYDSMTDTSEEVYGGDNGDPVINHDGSVIAFQSTIAPASGSVAAIVALVRGAGAVQVTRALDGVGPDGNSMNPAISANGQVVAFASLADDLFPSTVDSYDVFVVDLSPPLVVAWGADDYGQVEVPAGLDGVTAIAAGGFHSLAVKSNGRVVAWGDNTYGELDVPAGLTGVQMVAGGYGHSLALKSDGTVVAWGADRYGQSTVPSGLSGVIAVAAGNHHSLALRSDGTVVAWGDDGSGQATVPVGLSGVEAVAAGGEHSLALRSDGTVVAWGDNWSEQSTVPVGLSGVQAIAAGDYFSLALKSDGTVVGWGSNSHGQSAVPPGLSGVVAVAAGGYHGLALKADGTVVAWGDDGFGQRSVPSGLGDVIDLAAGGFHSLVLVDLGR